MKVAWVPPEYGDAIACILDDGTLSLWEEVTGGNTNSNLLLHSYKAIISAHVNLHHIVFSIMTVLPFLKNEL